MASPCRYVSLTVTVLVLLGVAGSTVAYFGGRSFTMNSVLPRLQEEHARLREENVRLREAQTPIRQGGTKPCMSDATRDALFWHTPCAEGFQYHINSKHYAKYGSTSKRGHICEIATDPSVVQAGLECLDFARLHAGQSSASPSLQQQESLESFRCASTGRVEYIEPVFVTLRHPFAKIGCSWPVNTSYNLFNISYLVVRNMCSTKAADPDRDRGLSKNLLFDLGCTTYDNREVCGKHCRNRIKRGITTTTGTTTTTAKEDRGKQGVGLGLGPSIPLFYQIFERNCIIFDRMFGWEIRQFDGSWWNEVPVEIREKLTFFNHGVSPEPSKSSSSVLELIRASAKPSDFVVLKVDIDMPEIEFSIVKTIAETPEIANLIDEIFFEFHVYMDGLNFGWGTTAHNVDVALELFHKLRRMGIRAHTWI